MNLSPHRRRNPLSGGWVVVSPHRALRPWNGSAEPASPAAGPPYDAECHLCPGNRRTNGASNPQYAGAYTFPNDFPALQTQATPAEIEEDDDPLFTRGPARGEAHVLCFSPHHSRTLPELDLEAVEGVVAAWCGLAEQLEGYEYVQVFENKGAMMGCSSPHPHGQVWASDFVPLEIAREDACQAQWREAHGDVLLERVVAREIAEETRVVDRNDDWLAIVPWWAAWPFETLLIARRPVARLQDLDDTARRSLADILRRLTARYDNLFGVSFPYSMGWHQPPRSAKDPSSWRLHAHFYPPLLRSATVRKFMVGYEMLAEPQRDLTPEQAAERLRAASPTLEPRA